MNQYFVYILSNASQTLYIGVTNNLQRRLHEHKDGTTDGFTARYNVSSLLYFESFANIHDAIAREKQLKGWTRKKKLDLIRTTNPLLNDLSASWKG